MSNSKENGLHMGNKTSHAWLYFLIGFVTLSASLWSLMWFFSSASLASGFCNNQFSLLHEHFRCRQPYLAIISFAVLGLISLTSFVIGVRRFKGSKSSS